MRKMRVDITGRRPGCHSRNGVYVVDEVQTGCEACSFVEKCREHRAWRINDLGRERLVNKLSPESFKLVEPWLK